MHVSNMRGMVTNSLKGEMIMYIQKLGKRSFSLWFDKGTKSISINAEHKEWTPRIAFHENGGRRKNKDSCFDCTLILGTICMSYTNWSLQREHIGTRYLD